MSGVNFTKPSDFDALFDAAKSGDKGKMEKLGNAAAASLSEQQKSAVERALSDPEYLKELLSSEKAQNIINKLQGGK